MALVTGFVAVWSALVMIGAVYSIVDSVLRWRDAYRHLHDGRRTWP